MFALETKMIYKMTLFRFMFYLALTHCLLSGPLVAHARSIGSSIDENAARNTLFYKIDKYLRTHPEEQIEALLSEEKMAPINDGETDEDGGSFAEKRSAPLLPAAASSPALSSASAAASGSSSSSSNTNKASHEAFAENTLSYIIRFYKLLKHNQMNQSQRNMIMTKIGYLKKDLMTYLKMHPENEAPVFYILNKLDYEAESSSGANDENKMRTKQPFKWGK